MTTVTVRHHLTKRHYGEYTQFAQTAFDCNIDKPVQLVNHATGQRTTGILREATVSADGLTVDLVVETEQPITGDVNL